jgi:hypothetical protein
MAEKALEIDCKERVALDLMLHIANETSTKEQSKSKDYWFSLYAQCYQLAAGSSLEVVKRIASL